MKNEPPDLDFKVRRHNWKITMGNLCATPYNNRFNPTQRGRHALCSLGLWDGSFGKGRAGTPFRPSFPGRSKGGHSFAG
jgi:hypothetical protein